MKLEEVFEHYKERASQHLELDENFVENLSNGQALECAKQHVNVIKTAAVQKAYKERNLKVYHSENRIADFNNTALVWSCDQQAVLH